MGTGRAGSARAGKGEPVERPAGLCERVLFGGVAAGQLAPFFRQFAAYLDAGVDVIKSLKSLRGQFAGTALGGALAGVERSVRQGSTLSDAMAAEPRAFDRLTVSLVRVAEARGGLVETCRSLAEHFEKRQRLVRMARSASIYPTLVLLGAMGVAILVSVVVLPMLADIARDFARGNAYQLPLPTRVLIGFSDFMRSFGWWLVPAALVAAVFGGIYAYRTEAGKAVIDALVLRIPVIGGLRRNIDLTRVMRTLSTLLQSGLDVTGSLKLTGEVAQLGRFRSAMHRAGRDVRGGFDLGAALASTDAFPRDVLAMIEAGEETGQLPEQLGRVADEYQDRVEYTVRNLGSLLMPTVVVVLGGIVLFVLLGVVLLYRDVLMNLAG